MDGTPLAPATVTGGAASATISTLTAGSHAITATFTSGDPNFANSTATATTLAVQKNPVTALLSVTSASPVYNAANSAKVTVTASSGSPTGTVQFSVDGTASGSAISLSGGVATYALPVLTAGPHTIAANYSGDANFAATPAAGIAVTVTKAASTVTWATPASIVYGTALSATQLNATASVPGTFVYTPAVGVILNASAQPQTLSVTFTPTDAVDYTGGTRTTTITVTQATPAITWAAPASITYGTALSATQLNATAPVAGAFVYTPAAGTVLGATTQTLSTTFTPTDTTDYTVATKTTTLVVAKQGTNTVLAVSAATINPGQSITFTATVTSVTPPGTPTGSVTFMDGTNVLGTSNLLASGAATFSTINLLSGSHSITALYSGDANYTASSATSSATGIVVAPLDFSLSGSSTLSSLFVKAGTPAIFAFQVAPAFGSYPAPVTFSVSGLPSGHTATFSPASIPVNGGSVTVTLTIQTAGLSARNAIERHGSVIAFALLLLPISLARKFRRARPNLNRLFMLAILLLLAAAAGRRADGLR